MTSEQRLEGGERRTHGCIWGMNISSREHSLCKGTGVGADLAQATSSGEAEQDAKKQEYTGR